MSIGKLHSRIDVIECVGKLLGKQYANTPPSGNVCPPKRCGIRMNLTMGNANERSVAKALASS